MKTNWHECIQRYVNGQATPEEAAALQKALKEDAEMRALYLDYMNLDVALGAAAEAAAMTGNLPARAQASQIMARTSGWHAWLSWRPFTAAAAGLVAGLFCASVVWAYAGPWAVATVSQLFQLKDGGFEGRAGRVPSGFPMETGVWRGDVAEMTTTDAIAAKEGRQVLRFIEAEPAAGAPDGPADGCDVFQIVDLRPLRGAIIAGRSSLELSASFADTRRATGEPIDFFCHLYVCRGQPESARRQWVASPREALAFAAGGFTTTCGAEKAAWRTQTVRVLPPPDSDFAVVLVTAVRHGGSSTTPARFGEQFVDDVKLVLRTQPELPVRVTHR
ncbi:MAG: hypothetical protein HZA91_01905 [Verrucomicrobia bacterium]|nr:hypothetical protein [Verrucomicrobiota bacterium]